jgi:hypothetical protein
LGLRLEKVDCDNSTGNNVEQHVSNISRECSTIQRSTCDGSFQNLRQHDTKLLHPTPSFTTKRGTNSAHSIRNKATTMMKNSQRHRALLEIEL